MGTKRKKTTKQKRATAASLLTIGASEKTIAAARAAVFEIMRQKQHPSVLIQALQTFEKICAVNNVTISGCTFTTK